MSNNRILLRTSYWVAAIADFVIAFLVLIPARMGVDAFVYPMGLMSAVAFSWGVLLIIADREPMARRWILLPTMLVVFLLVYHGSNSRQLMRIMRERAATIKLATAVLLFGIALWLGLALL